MTLIDQVHNSGAIPALEMMLRFAGQRQRLIAGSIANIDTPDYRPRDVDPGLFQESLGRAIDAQRAGGGRGDLRLRRTREFETDGEGGLRLTPRTPSGNVLFHDRNDRDLERLMQNLTENAGVYRVAAEFLRARTSLIHAAIRETP